MRPSFPRCAARLIRRTLLGTMLGGYALSSGAAPPPVAGFSEREIKLRAALAVFDGEWEGTVTIKSLDGAVLKRAEARRVVQWDGYAQVIETRLDLGSGSYVTTRRQSVALGVLKATVGRPRQTPGSYTGVIGEPGISWKGVEHPQHEYIERVAMQGDRRMVECMSLEPIQAAGISGLVRIEGLLWKLGAEPEPTVVAADDAGAATSQTQASRADESAEAAGLRIRLAAVEAELARLRGLGTASESTAVPVAAAIVVGPEQSKVLEPTPPPPAGSIHIKSEPADAIVEIDGQAAGSTPLTVAGLVPGRHAVSVSLPGHRTEVIALDLAPGSHLDAGVVALRPLLGSIAVLSEPAGLAFEILPAGSGPMAQLIGHERARSGTTPARYDDLPVGRYVVETRRDAWPVQVTEISVDADGSTEVRHDYVGGIVVVESTPAGARVLAGDAFLGVTPLVLKDVAPGEFAARIHLRGYRAADVSAVVDPRQPTTLAHVLTALDYFSRASELDVPPALIRSVPPENEVSFRPSRQTVHVAVIVGVDGVPRQPELVRTDDPTLVDRCLVAVAHWRFKPGLVDGQPVAVRVVVPFFFE